ncbi:MAG: hypothetical protein HY647_05060 [Acidobacteria bacterium]|nr:hypothetical protein [Acidobacteriota bacterium]
MAPSLPAKWRWIFACLLLGTLLGGCRQQSRLRVVLREPDPVLELAAREVAARLGQKGYQVEIATGPQASAGQVHAIILNVAPSGAGLEPEGYRVMPMRAGAYWLVRVTGHDPRGTLWGALDVAEQIVSEGRWETLQPATQNRYLSIRAVRLPLPLPTSSLSQEEQVQARDLWRQYFEGLARSRLNALFFQAEQPLLSFLQIPGLASPPSSLAEHPEASTVWLRELFQLARERGLDPYLALTRPALEGLVTGQKSAPSAETSGQPGLSQVLPAVFDAYPQLAGAMLEEDLLSLAGPGENRSRWLIENFLAPLAQTGKQHFVFLGMGKQRWLSSEALAAVQPSVAISLEAPLERITEIPDHMQHPVLWQVGLDSPELLPWQDPEAIRGALARMSDGRSLGFVGDFYAAEPANKDGRSTVESYLPPSTEWDWFRFMILGRMGYAQNLADTYWRQQFASRFDARAGPSVSSAAASASRLLQLLRDWEGDGPWSTNKSGEEGLIAASGPFPFVERRLFQIASDRLLQVFAAKVLTQNDWLVETQSESERKTEDPLGVADILEQEARLVLTEVEKATRLGAWKATVTTDFRQRLEKIATSSLAHAEYLRAVSALAQFLLEGAESSRQQAITHLQQAQQALQTGAAGSSAENLSSRISRAIEFSSQWQPWSWERTDWQVGTLPEWKPDSAGAIPLPSPWQSVQTSALAEFGLYGRQPWMTALNRQLRLAFLPAQTPEPPRDGSLLVGRTVVAAQREGRLVLRVVSDQPGSVWVNRRRAYVVSPEQFPWVAASEPSPPWNIQLFSAPVRSGDNEVIVAAPAQEIWPRFSLHSLLAPEASDTVRIAAREAAHLEGGLVFVPGTESFPQPHIALPEERTTADFVPQNQTEPWALYRIQVPAAGFYRLRLWVYWENAASQKLDLFLDGLVLQKGVGRQDETIQRWQWLTAEPTVALGPSVHTLAIRGWKAGARLGMVEVFPAW